MAEGLTVKQSMFIKEYLIDKNATQAAIRAGYSVKTAEVIGYENLNKPYIRDIIDAELNKMSEKLGLDAEWVLKRLKLISDRCIQGEPVIDKEGNETGEYKFDSTGANKATELIGKHLKLFTDKIEATSDQTITIRIEDSE